MRAYRVPGRITCTSSQCARLATASLWLLFFTFSPAPLSMDFRSFGDGRSMPYLASSFSLVDGVCFRLLTAVTFWCRCIGHLIHSFLHLHRHAALGRISLQCLHFTLENPDFVRSFDFPTFWASLQHGQRMSWSFMKVLRQAWSFPLDSWRLLDLRGPTGE